MSRFNIYYRKYVVFGRAYGSFVKVVYTDNIYEEIGKLICNSLEHIDHVRYTEPRASFEECEKLWLDEGYQKISDNLYMSSKPFIEGAAPDIDVDTKCILSVIKEAGINSMKKNDYFNFLSNRCYLFEDLFSYEFIGVYERCKIKDGCLYDKDGNILSSNGGCMDEQIPYFVEQTTGYLGDDYYGVMYIKVDNQNTFVAVRYSC